MDIFSKRDGPRLEDVKARRLLSENSGTIRKLADQISNGGYSRMRAEEARRRQEPKPEGLIIHDMKARPATDAPQPYVKVSINNRVVLVDKSTGPAAGAAGRDTRQFPVPALSAGNEGKRLSHPA